MKNKKSSSRNMFKQPSPSLAQLQKKRKTRQDIYKEMMSHLSTTDKLAVVITKNVGTMGFFLIILLWSFFWLGWNFLAPKEWVFDPPMGFVFWLFISNLIQLLLMPLIMIGQNLQDSHIEKRAKNDLEINIQAEQEITLILKHLEYQNNILLKLIKQLKIKCD